MATGRRDERVDGNLGLKLSSTWQFYIAEAQSVLKSRLASPWIPMGFDKSRSRVMAANRGWSLTKFAAVNG